MSRNGSIGNSLSALERSYSRRHSKGQGHADDDPTVPLLSKPRENGQAVTPAVKPHTRTKRCHDDGLLNKILHDNKYRSNLVKTFWIWFCFLVFGWTYSQIGTTLPDVQLILDLDLEEASWLFSTFSIGYLIGCLGGGFLVGRLQTFLLLGVYCLFGTVLIVVLPWSDIYWLTLAIRLLHGICIGGIDTTGHAETFRIWKLDAGVYISILYLSYALGGIFSPFANEPFLARRYYPNDSTDAYDSGLFPNYSLAAIDGGFNKDDSAATNDSKRYPKDTVIASDINGSNMGQERTFDAVNSTENDPILYGPTRIHTAYLISGVITFIACVACFTLVAKSTKLKRHGTSTADLDGIDLRKKPSKPVFVLALFLMSLIMVIVTGFEDNFPGFLMSFTLYQLNWTKTTGALATSMFWVAYAVGNFLCIFLMLHMRTQHIVFVYSSVSIGGLVGLLCACLYRIDVLVWVFILLIGFSTSSLWPCLFTWTEENITPVTGMLSSLYLVSGSVGLFLNPLALGHMMDLYSPMWFVYIMLMEGVAVMVLFCTVVLIYSNVKLPEQVVDRLVV